MPEPIITKRCSGCKQVKSVGEFYKNKSRKGGYGHYCKICKNQQVKQYRNSEHGRIVRTKYEQSERYKNIIKISYKKYNNTQKGKKRACRAQKKYYRSNQYKIKAHRAINNAIAAGRFPRASTFVCMYCYGNSIFKQAKEYHHYSGYNPDSWFCVIPLCKRCHTSVHKTNP